MQILATSLEYYFSRSRMGSRNLPLNKSSRCFSCCKSCHPHIWETLAYIGCPSGSPTYVSQASQRLNSRKPHLAIWTYPWVRMAWDHNQETYSAQCCASVIHFTTQFTGNWQLKCGSSEPWPGPVSRCSGPRTEHEVLHGAHWQALRQQGSWGVGMWEQKRYKGRPEFILLVTSCFIAHNCSFHLFFSGRDNTSHVAFLPHILINEWRC